MKSLKMFIAFLACVAALSVIKATLSAPSETSSPTRKFRFTYIASIPALPAGAKTSRIWIPLPQSDRYQTISDLKIEAPFAYAQHRDAEYGNEYLYLQVPAPEISQPADVRVSFEATRHEHRVPLDAHAPASTSRVPPPDLQRFLQPDRLVPLQGTIAELSSQQTQGLQEPLAKARAIYNYVLATMRYDKSGTGWGNGDAIWACTANAATARIFTLCSSA